ncbi:tetraacyldisaccharide 4'-kinase [Flavisolibacter ginsenosidimutans]|uniref:Tetraacyldisaccharide 4'-kinase n=1 Tax=Flavisolibacter ginsenosidimutans TaxID=661481 RepID=A0A5B8UFD6_9BACT|nr:tetraacyldisaccharide 4'-kinase [Flavisolibacter ginsenosidimutans]QEC55381.1 tetraacyldisaccharide 4'-kinase [Flavisolibacter ginsenosidimutans]
MFSNWFLKSFRILLLPFALLFGFVVSIRNWLYDKNILKSSSFGLPLICVGNLSVGGTGKSPMVEFLVLHLKGRYKVATLSRGYKRKTKGYALANAETTAIDIGDEPLQFYKKFPDVPVAIGEERLVAIPQLLHDKPDTQVIILDDAFQHRAIKAGLNILLTDCGNLFTRDFYLPTGDLRDARESYKRAQIIVVTKCPPDLPVQEKEALIKEIDPQKDQRIFFTTIAYGTPYHITHHNFTYIEESTEMLLVTGIANPRPLKTFLEERIQTYYMMHYNDHHIFSIDDWRDIKKRFESIEAKKKMILTTEKDAMRLLKFAQEIDGMPFYVMPIEHKFLFGEEVDFLNAVTGFIENFKTPA